jgi:hypothetical protein
MSSRSSWAITDSPGTDLMNGAGAIVLQQDSVFMISFNVFPILLNFTGSASLTLSITPTNGVAYTLPPVAVSGSAPVALTHLFIGKAGDSFAVSSTLPTQSTPPVETAVTLRFFNAWVGPSTVMCYQSPAIGQPVVTAMRRPPLYMRGVLTANTGKITFYLTDSGTSTGRALFPNGFFATFTASAPVNSPIANTILASEESRTADNTAVTANVVTGTTTGILLGGTISSFIAAPVNSVVYVIVEGS